MDDDAAMVEVTRRQIAGGLIATGLHALARPQAMAASDMRLGQSLRGHVHGLGLNPKLFPSYDLSMGLDATVLTSLDLTTGKTRQSLLPMGGGHMTCSLPTGNLLCIAHHKSKSLVVNDKHEVLAELSTDQDHVFGGHGLVLAERNIILLPQRRKVAHDLNDHGSLIVVDASSLKPLDQIETGGIHPHELHPIPGTNELAVTHYGDISDPHPIFEHNVVDPKLTILDSRTLRPKRHYPQPGFKAMVTHMRVDEAGWAYLVLTQYVRWPSRRVEDPFQVAMKELQRAIGRPIDYMMAPAALEERLLPLPLPLLAVDTQTGKRRTINTGDRMHLRSQSVAYNAEARTAVGIYAQSNSLVIVRSNGPAVAVDAARLGLRNVRGIVDIPGTPFVAVMGAYSGVAIFDLSKDKVVNRYDTSNYLDTHLSYTE